MKKTFTLAVRNGKEILRDPLNLFFGLAFPLLLLLLLVVFVSFNDVMRLIK